MRAEVEYTALISVTVDPETGAVASVGIEAPGDEDETPSEVTVSLESETGKPDKVLDRGSNSSMRPLPSSSAAGGLPRRRNDRVGFGKSIKPRSGRSGPGRKGEHSPEGGAG